MTEITTPTLQELYRAEIEDRPDSIGGEIAALVTKSGSAKTMCDIAADVLSREPQLPIAIGKAVIASYVSGIAIGLCIAANRLEEPAALPNASDATRPTDQQSKEFR